MVAFFRLLRRVQLQTPMYQGTTMEKQLFILNRSLWNINGRVPAKICIHSYRSDIYKLKSKPKLLCCHTELVNHHLRDCCSKSTTTSTIFALSSGHGKCGVAVIRISGPHTRIVLEKIVKLKQLPKSRHALLRKLLHPSTGEPLDKSLVLWFPGPESFTGEDCCELHVHGGSAVITAVLDALAQLPSFRHAEAGEFTKRAFLNGKLDLTEVEGLSDLIHAETEAQRKQALIQMEGTLGQLYMGWRKTLLKCTANVEAFIDFSEDEQIEDGVLQEARDDVTKAMGEIRAHLADNRKGERLRSGVHVAIIGEPNVGKSSLLNVLCQRPAAIVSPMAGTTRDVLETALNLGGYPIIVSDTAGLRHTGHEIEAEGVRRALQRARQADLKILVLEATRLENSLKKGESAAINIDQHLRRLGILQCDQTSDITTGRGHVIESAHHTQHDGGGLGDYIVVFNKWDLLSNPSQIRNEIVDKADVSLSPLSCITEEGMEDFLEVLHKKVKALCANPSTGNPSLTQARYRFHLEQCVTSLTAYLELCDSDVVLAAMQLHGALRNIGKLTGKITSDEILDVIFRDFCIGK